MKNWIRVTLVSSVLIGGTALLSHQLLREFDEALNNLSASYSAIASMPSVSPSEKRDGEQGATTTPENLSTSATSTDVHASFTFPKKGGDLYSDCTYPIGLQSSSTIDSLEIALVDAGTREVAGPIASGLAKESNIEPGSQTLAWKVGMVWPGEYFILISNINGVTTETQSEYFLIHEISEDVSTSTREAMCKETGGVL